MRVGVIGAGLSGLVAARDLVAEGHDVVVLDKGRSVGGRLATRRIGAARLDHGAQFFTTRSDDFTATVAEWERNGVVRVWTRGFSSYDGHPRYVATNGMNTVAKQLAVGLDVRCGVLAFAVRPRSTGWTIVDDRNEQIDVDAVVVTTPVPQAMSLLVEVRSQVPAELMSLSYNPTLCLLAEVSGSTNVPAPGGVQDADDVFSFIGDNHAKGVSDVGAITFHANAPWSEAWFDRDTDEIHAALLDAAQPWLGGATVIESQAKKWRFATPKTTWPERCCPIGDGSLVLAGDAYGGPKVEGAYLSGRAAAASLCR
jgi:renalase